MGKKPKVKKPKLVKNLPKNPDKGGLFKIHVFNKKSGSRTVTFKATGSKQKPWIIKSNKRGPGRPRKKKKK